MLKFAADISKATTSGLSDLLNLSFGSFTLEKLLRAIVILVVCLIVKKLIIHVFERFINRFSIDRTLQNFFMSAVKGILIFIIIIIMAESFGIPSTSLVAIFSVLGLAVSLAVQGFLSNLAGGIMILVSKPFTVGDFIDVASYTGTVSQTSLIYTHLLTADHKVIYIPNSEISTSKIINYTRQTHRRIEIFVGASYNAPLENVKAALQGAINALPYFEKEPAPAVHVSAYQESAIQYVIHAWVPTEAYWDAYYELMEGIKKSFDEHGIEMTYPHLNVHLVQNGSNNAD